MILSTFLYVAVTPLLADVLCNGRKNGTMGYL